MKKVLGLSIILFGGLLLLSNLDILVFDSVSHIFFPTVLIFLGLSGMVDKKRIALFDCSMVTLGTLFLLGNLNIINSDLVWQIFWPMLIIAVGFTFLINLPYKFKKDANETKYTAVMSGVEGKNESNDFVSSEVTAFMGGAELDFSKIKIKNKQAVININVVLGGVTIKVPRDVKLKINGTPILGGCENKAESDMDSKKELIINYVAILGGVEIIN